MVYVNSCMIMKIEQALIELAEQLVVNEGINSTAISSVSVIKVCEQMKTQVPVVYDPCVYMVLQGGKSAFLGKETFVYDPMNYLVLSVPLPLECKIHSASIEKPYIAVKLSIDKSVLNELLEELRPVNNTHDISTQLGIFVSEFNDNIKSTLSRLLTILKNNSQAHVLGQLAIKELLFHVLSGPQGEILKTFVHQDRKDFHIAKVIGVIQRHGRVIFGVCSQYEPIFILQFSLPIHYNR